MSQGRLFQICLLKHARNRDESKKLLCQPFLSSRLSTAVGIILLPEESIHLQKDVILDLYVEGKIVVES